LFGASWLGAADSALAEAYSQVWLPGIPADMSGWSYA
jgi:hypothetical protein